MYNLQKNAFYTELLSISKRQFSIHLGHSKMFSEFCQTFSLRFFFIKNFIIEKRDTDKDSYPIYIYTVDSWSQYNNPEEGAQLEGDIRRKSRKTITTEKTLLWPNGIVKYYVHSSIGEFLQI